MGNLTQKVVDTFVRNMLQHIVNDSLEGNNICRLIKTTIVYVLTVQKFDPTTSNADFL